MYERAFIQSKIAKKRASQDSITREQRSNNSFKGNKKGMA